MSDTLAWFAFWIPFTILVVMSPVLYVIIRDKLRGPGPEYRTIDGDNLCPYPGMTDEELYDFEADMDTPRKMRTWPTLEDFHNRPSKNIEFIPAE